LQKRFETLDPLETPMKAAVRQVELRGNIQVNHTNGHVVILRALDFAPRKMSDEPIAIFRNADVAKEVCRDLADIVKLYNCTMYIEGHTKGGETEFWQLLAKRRAQKVAETMIEFGAEECLLRTKGLPGRLEKNEVRTVIFMDIHQIEDDAAPLPVVDVIENGYYGGRFVEGRKGTARPQSPGEEWRDSLRTRSSSPRR